MFAGANFRVECSALPLKKAKICTVYNIIITYLFWYNNLILPRHADY